MPESGRKSWCESGRCEGKTQQQGEVRPDQAMAFFKWPLSPGSGNPTNPFCLGLPLNYFQQTEVNQNNPAFCPGFGSGSWLHSGECPGGDRSLCLCLHVGSELLTEPCRALWRFESHILAPHRAVVHLHHQLLVCPGRAACLRVGVITKEDAWGSPPVLEQVQ